MSDAETLGTTYGGRFRAGPRLDAMLAVPGVIAVAGLVLHARTTLDGGPPELIDRALLAVGGVVGLLVLATSRDDSGVVPRSYRPAAVGALLILLGVVADITWAAALGTAPGIAAAIRPPALVMALGVGLFGTAPVAGAWRRRSVPVGWDSLPVLAGTILGYATVTAATASVHPFVELGDPAAGVPAIVVQAALLSGVVALLLARFEPGPGAFTVILLGSGVVAVAVGGPAVAVAAALIAGVLLDGVYLWFDPSPSRSGTFRAFAGVAAATFGGVTLLVTALTGSLDWPIAATTGAVLAAGIAGWLVGYLVLTPIVPEGATRGTIPALAGTEPSRADESD